MFVLAVTCGRQRLEDVLRGPPSCLLVAGATMHAMLKENIIATKRLHDLCNVWVYPEQRIFRILQ